MNRSSTSAWESLRRWKRWEYAPFGVWFILVMFPQTIVVTGPLFAGLIVVLAVKVQFFNCPQCGDLFFYRSGFTFYQGWAKACLHCGHPIWAEPVPAPPVVDPHPWPLPKPRPDPCEQQRAALKVFLTLVLTSDPSSIGLKLDPGGWADLNKLIARSKRNGLSWTRDQVVELLENSSKPGFEIDPTGTRIRRTHS